jgi:hypothetical protein
MKAPAINGTGDSPIHRRCLARAPTDLSGNFRMSGNDHRALRAPDSQRAHRPQPRFYQRDDSQRIDIPRSLYQDIIRYRNPRRFREASAGRGVGLGFRRRQAGSSRRPLLAFGWPGQPPKPDSTEGIYHSATEARTDNTRESLLSCVIVLYRVLLSCRPGGRQDRPNDGNDHLRALPRKIDNCPLD